MAAVVEKDTEKKPPSLSYAITAYGVGGAFLLTLAVGFLYSFDKDPWPTIGAACLTYIFGFFGLQLVSDGGRDAHLIYFLTSQLLLAYFSKLDPHKGPDGDSPISASSVYPKTNPHLRLGLAQFIKSRALLETIETTCIISWILAIVLSFVFSKEKIFRSWMNKVVFTVLCLSYFFLHGVMAGLNGVSHRFYLPAYSFVGILSEVILDIDSNPYICTFAGFTFVSAGISKLRNSNLSWLDGKALCRHIRKDYNTGMYGTFCSTMAPLSIFFEVVAPQLMFLGSTGRILFVLFALSFHLGIAILMFPRYTPQACTYALIFRRNPKKARWPFLFGIVGAVLVATTAFRIEAWPLTAVPMYSIDVEDNFGSSLEDAFRVARIVHTTGCSSGISFPDRYLKIDMDPNHRFPKDCSLVGIGKIKLVKQFLINGLASALVCIESDASCDKSKNFWFDKYSNAVHEKCRMPYIRYSLVLKRGHNQSQFGDEAVEVYKWDASMDRKNSWGEIESVDPQNQEL